MRNHWLVTEIALLREKYATAPSSSELMALFPRHTAGSVHRMARIEGLLRPQRGVTKIRPGLERVFKAIEENGPLTSHEIGEILGVQYRAVENIKHLYRSQFRIAGWVPPANGGKWAPKWAKADGLPDAPKPFVRKKAKVYRKQSNPFLIAAGFIPSIPARKGRIIINLVDVDQEAV